MKVFIRNKEAFSELNYRDVLAYLLGQGWREISRISDKATVLTLQPSEGKERELIVPLRHNLGDYASRLAEVVNTLAEVEQRSELTVLNDLSVAGVDVIRIRAPQADKDGTISVKKGVVLCEQARELLLSAACAAHEIRPTYHTGKVTEAVSYLDSVRLGQTERGSYILTFLSPVDPSLRKLSSELPVDGDKDPYPRKVTKMLAKGLDSLKHALVIGSIDAFEDSIQQGVSANLCDSVAELIDQGGGADISLTWARTRPSGVPNTSVCFVADDAGLLREAAREFRSREPRTDLLVTGWVNSLARAQEDFNGKATLKVLLEGERRARSIQVSFPHADYEKVIDAHKKKNLLSVEGDLVQTGQRYELRNPRKVSILPSEDDSEDFGEVDASGGEL